ncbi:26S proteasome regulatory subunit 6A isoform X2 [Serinus canaria]|uniref:26S proteasome regulatory subunit 6A isoform X2 n=1 Tax=Serinus canaria TaxID=9135 RepID=UPI0021CC6C40|nr:26S proteasome regulatory subunit 6A isoform X2 [Serinus canaria]
MCGGDGAVLWHVWRVHWGEEQPAPGTTLLPLLPLEVPPDQRDPRLPQLPPLVGEARLRLSARGPGRGRTEPLPGPLRLCLAWASSASPARGRLTARPHPLPPRCCVRALAVIKAFSGRPPRLPPAPGSGHRPRPAPPWRRRHHSAGLGAARDPPAAPRPAGRFGTAAGAAGRDRGAGGCSGGGEGARNPRAARPARGAAPALRRPEPQCGICRAEPAAPCAHPRAGGKMASVWDESEDGVGEEVLKMSTEEIVQRTRLLDSEIKIMKSEVLRVTHELQAMKDKIKENSEKIKVNKTLPYLVSNVIELLDVDPNDQEEDGANIDLDSQRKGKCAVIKTSTRQTYFLPVIGLVDAEKLKPGDLVGVNKDSYLILETLPTEYDSRVKAMEVDERPTEQYSDIGGLDKQIQELVEAIVLPMNHKEKFENLGIQPPKGVLMYGPPGTGKTLLARACAAQTKATFLKLAGPQLVQMFIGDGAKLVRDAFALAKEKAPSIIFIDELDAIGTKRFDSEKAGDREVQRTMLELLNQLDGFQPNTQVKVIAATNRVDILDPALLRSGRLDRKIEFPMPNEEARARIMQIHSRKMNVSPDVNYEELARCTDDFNGAQCKAVCVEAGMIALRRGATELTHEDYMEGILEVQAKKKANLQYYA